MLKYEFSQDGFHFVRVSKKVAKAAYNNGLDMIICPCNLRPNGMWHNGVRLQNNNIPFTAKVNEFIFFTCHNSETGRYPAFYLPVNYRNFCGDLCIANSADAICQYDERFLS